IIFGWLILSFIDEYIYSFSLENYKIAIFFLLTGTNIIVSIILFNLKRTAKLFKRHIFILSDLVLELTMYFSTKNVGGLIKSVLLLIGILVYILLFFAFVFFSLKFQFGKEGKDERGKEILNISYGFAFPLVILGWFIISLINEYMVSLSLESYQTAIWFLITGTYIVHATILLYLKRTA